MKSQLKWLATATCAAVWSAYAWADIQVDNVAALSGLSVSGGNYARVQFQLDDQRFTVTGAEALGDVIWVKSIGVVQRPNNTIAANSTLRIQQSTGTNASTGLSSSQNAAVIAISQPLSASSTETLTVGTASQTLRTYTFAAPFPLKKSTLYTASFYNESGTAANQQLAMYNDSTNQTTQNTNTTIHASADANYSPCVRIIAVERSKLADVGETATWSGLWSEAPASTDTVGLNVTAANAALTMDTSATVAGLAIGSETAVGPLTISGSGSLTSSTTSIATDTNVSAITANLGAVTLASGKTLTVGNATTLSGLVGEVTSQVVYNLGASLADEATRRNLIQNFPGVVTFKATGATGATLAYAADSTASLASCLAFDGGTHTFKYGRSTGQGYGLFATGRGDDVPTIDVKKDTTLEFYEKDLSGWNGTVQAKPAVIRVRNGGTLNFQDYGGSGFFRDRLVLDGGASVTMAGSNFVLHGGTQDAAHAQIAMLDSNTAVEATLAGQIGITNINGGQAGQKASTIAVGNNATLKASAKFVGTVDGGSLTKVGSGTLELSSTETNTSNALTISAGKVLIKNGSSWGTGAITVAESAALEVEVSSADTTKIFANTLSGAGTVKKLGAGTLSLTGSVSTPVEVAAGTLDIGTNRPAVNALASGAVLKVKATVAELSAQTITLTVGASLTDVTASQFSVVDDTGSAVEGFSAAVADGTLTITLPSVLPTLTVTDDTQTWTNSASWPTSGAVKVDASAVTTAKTITIPASEATRTFSTLTVVAPATVQVTIAVESGNTIGALLVDGSVAMAVGAVNAITNSVTVNAGGILEVVVAENEDLTLTTPISGAGTFAKGGAGVLTLGANITTTGGSIVQSGTLNFGTGSITTESNPGNYTANAMGDVLVCENAVLDLKGKPNLWLREITLKTGATYKNSGSELGTSTRQLQKVTLLGDATVVADANFGLLAHGHTATTLTLNGHTLTKQGNSSFWLMNTTVTGTSGKIVVEAGSMTNTGANKTVTFSIPITLESTLTGTPFDLTGNDVTASDNLTANGPVSFAKLITGSGKTIVGTGTVTVTDMTLGGPLNVTGNLVIDRATVTDTRSFANAIKVASGGSLTTKGNITWNSSDNEFLGSLTVA
ncbi:MAG: beta strand repeat-containing protein, partial [Candidatus Spyradenecus sp.]